MYTINKEDMQLIVNGASFLASGGGGGVGSANDVIDNVLTFADEVTVATLDDIQDNKKLLVICGVGAPDAPDLNFKDSPGYGLNGLQSMTGNTFDYVLPIEVGAMNSTIPLLACAQLGIPFIDGDGAGRSVPQMSMCTYALQEFQTSETLVVSEEDDQYPLHPENADGMETQVRNIVSTKLKDAGTVATWPITSAEIKSPDAFVPGSLSLAKEIGVAMQSNTPLESVETIISGYYSDYLVLMNNGKVTQATNAVKDGFDVGSITVEQDNLTITLYFVNESLLATIDQGGTPLAFILGPDMICSMGVDGSPMTNSEIYAQFARKEDVYISLMWVKAVDAIRTPEMFFKYLSLLAQKFGKSDISAYKLLGNSTDISPNVQ